MKFTTLIARFPGTCKRCKQPIAPGERIRYGGKGLTYHLAADCHTTASFTLDDAIEQQTRQPEPPVMTPQLAQSIRQEFESLLTRPARLIDMADEPTDTADDSPEDDTQPKQFTFSTIAGATVRTVPTPKTASIDADLF